MKFIFNYIVYVDNEMLGRWYNDDYSGNDDGNDNRNYDDNNNDSDDNNDDVLLPKLIL